MRSDPTMRRVVGGRPFRGGDPANNCLADLNIYATVGILDLLTLLANWGPCA